MQSTDSKNRTIFLETLRGINNVSMKSAQRWVMAAMAKEYRKGREMRGRGHDCLGIHAVITATTISATNLPSPANIMKNNGAMTHIVKEVNVNSVIDILELRRSIFLLTCLFAEEMKGSCRIREGIF